MSDGAITSQPISACSKACLTNISFVLSLSILFLIKRPSWPWLVYGSKATSHITPISLYFFLILIKASQTKLFSFRASEPILFFFRSGVWGNNAIIGNLNFRALSIIKPSLSIEYLLTPGIDLISSTLFLPSFRKIGKIKSLFERLFSDTSLLTQSELRTLLNLVSGYLTFIFMYISY